MNSILQHRQMQVSDVSEHGINLQISRVSLHFKGITLEFRELPTLYWRPGAAHIATLCERFQDDPRQWAGKSITLVSGYRRRHPGELVGEPTITIKPELKHSLMARFLNWLASWPTFNNAT